MAERFERTELLLGREAMEKLKASKVIVFGIGGVGGYAVEAMARSGIGRIDLVDNDLVSISNINRQIIATDETVGKSKVEVMEKRIHSINPDCEVHCFQCFYLPENKEEFHFSDYDYVIDAVDTVTAKLSLIAEAHRLNVPIVSAMGAGNKLDPTAFKVTDIYKTKVCPLAKVMRRECKKRGIESLKVVYSEEEPTRPQKTASEKPDRLCTSGSEEVQVLTARRDTPGSISFVPPVCGFILAGEVIKDLLRKNL